MVEELVKCPCCGSEACLYGELETDDRDNQYVYTFYPLHIKKKTFWTIFRASVKLEKGSIFYGCPDCGHLWSKLRVEQYKKLIEHCGWQGGKQVEPPPNKPYVMWFVLAVIGILIAAIAFFKLSI